MEIAIVRFKATKRRKEDLTHNKVYIVVNQDIDLDIVYVIDDIGENNLLFNDEFEVINTKASKLLFNVPKD